MKKYVLKDEDDKHPYWMKMDPETVGVMLKELDAMWNSPSFSDADRLLLNAVRTRLETLAAATDVETIPSDMKPWTAVIGIEGEPFAMFMYPDQASKWVSANWRDSPPRRLECAPPKVVFVERVKCEACTGHGTVIKKKESP